MRRNRLSKQIPAVSLLTGAMVWGLIWYPYRVLSSVGMEGWLSLTLSYLFALVPSLVLFRKPLFAAGFSPLLAAIGLSAGLCNIGYVLAMLGGEVMRVLLLFYMAPLWTVLLSRILLGERLDATGHLVILTSFAGAVAMLWSPSEGSIFPENHAEWLGLASGFMFALSNVLAKRGESIPVEARSASVSAGVVAAGIVLAFFQHGPIWHGITGYTILINFLMGAAIFAVNVVMQHGLSHTPANRAIVILLFELVVAAVSSYFLAGEAMTLQEWAGGSLIVSASILSGKIGKDQG